MASPFEDLFPVVPSAVRVMAGSASVFLHHDAVRPAIEKWGFMMQTAQGWMHPCHYFDGGEKTLQWIFVLDVLNQSFWPDTGETRWSVPYAGSSCSGYWGLAAALKRAVEEGVPIINPSFLMNLERADLRRVFSGEGEIPLFEERLRILREAGRVMEEAWGGRIVHLLESAGGSAVLAVKKMVESFPSFRDEAMYGGEKVFFWKRAQLFVADVHAAFSGRGPGEFADIDDLTVFADYKLPQVLRELGIISYHPTLAEKVDSCRVLVPGCGEEVEIRAATICAAEALRDAFCGREPNVNAIRVDNWLWRLGQLDEFRRKPYHRCRTIYY